MGKVYSALAIDTDDTHNEQLRQFFKAREIDVRFSKSITEAQKLVQEESLGAFLVVLLNINEDSFDVPMELLIEPPFIEPEVVLMGDSDEPTRAQEGIKIGASYFFCKPFDPGFLGDLIDELVTEADQAAATAVGAETGGVCGVDQFALLRGSSAVMRKLYHRLRRVAPTDATVIITGESGVGKELVAESIHHLSEHSDGPFLAINCGAISPELVESELFGHEKGAFSGAYSKHDGLFSQAQGGTLLLDELAEMPLEFQVKLLRVLETRRYRPVGSEQEREANVRILAATNIAPEDAIREGKLREDLFYRLAQYRIKVPPLRQRGKDICGLAQYFLNTINEEKNTTVSFSDEAIEKLFQHDWPGNVRELKNAVAHGHIVADHQITANDLPDFNMHGADDYLRVGVGYSIEATERKLIFATLEANSGDKQEASKVLGISLKTLYNRLNAYEQEKAEPRQ